MRSYRLQDNDVLDATQITWLRLTENIHQVQFMVTVADPSAGPEQQAIDKDIAQMLRHLVAELAPRKRSLLQALFTDNPRSYNEIARATGIPISSIGPTQARALRKLRTLGTAHGLG